MDKSLKASIAALLRAKRGFEFENIVNQLHLIRYGADGYQPTRERKDDGAEGIIVGSRTVVAAYGPDKYDENKYLKKVNDDFDDYLNKWASSNPNWKMHYNGSLTPEQIRVSDSLKRKAEEKGVRTELIIIHGIEQLIQFIEDEFSNKKIRQVCETLGVAKELIVIDHIRSIIDDLIKGVEIDKENVDYELKVDIEEKIELNYSELDVKAAKEEYEELAVSGNLKKIWLIISTYESEEINSLKLRIKRELNRLSGNFKEKIENLTEQYLNRYASPRDDDYEYFTRALLIYCFEQCMIGDKTPKEI